MSLDRWQISLLGEVSARRPECHVARFATRKAGSLFGFLAYQIERPQPRASIADLLWPDVDPATARNRLRVALASLRRQLEPPGTSAGSVLLATRDLLAFRTESSDVDVARFRAALRAATADPSRTLERLRRADEIYQGELMPGYEDDWVVAARQELSDLYLRSQLRLSAIYTDSGEYEPALHHARKAAAAEPLSEMARGAVIRVLLDRGERAAAHAELDAFRKLVRRKTGSRPSHDLEDLLYGRSPKTRATVADRAIQPAVPQPEAENPDVSFARPLGKFVGRAGDIEVLGSLLAMARILTLTGAAGVGKSRLAMEATIASANLFGAGTLFLSAVSLRPDSRIADRMLEALGVRTAGEPSLRRLQGILLSRTCPGTSHRFLLIVDGAELLPSDAIEELSAIVRETPIVTLLATSRRPLGLPGEIEHALRPLSAPEKTTTDLGALADNPSVHLLIERSKEFQPDFQINAHNAPLLSEICRRCEGFPLAIELAAASLRRVPAKKMAHVVAEMETGRSALDGALEHSWAGLPASLQKSAGRLCAFPASWDVDAASAVLNVENGQKTLDDLVANSLIVRDTAGPRARYRFLDAIRKFVCDRTEAQAVGEAQERHARHFFHRAAVFRTVAATLGPWKHQDLVHERENLAAAFDWFLASDPTGVEAARFVIQLPLHFYRFSTMREGRLWISKVSLPDPRSPEEFRLAGRLRMADGLLACQMGDSQAAEPLLAEAIELLARSNSELDCTWAHANHGFALYGLGQFQAAEEKFKLWLHGSYGLLPWVDSAIENLLGFALLAQSRLEEAGEEFHRSIRLNESLDDPASTVHSWLGIARIAWMKGEREEALELYRRCLNQATRFGDNRACAYSAQGFARVFAAAREWEYSAQAFGIAQRLRDEQGLRADAADQIDNEACIAGARKALGDRYKVLWQIGYEMGRNEAAAWLGQTNYRPNPF